MYQVYEHGYGRKIIKSGPMQGLPEWPQHLWEWTTQHRAKAKAIEICAAVPHHARVVKNHTAETVFDNGKQPYVPLGWIEG